MKVYHFSAAIGFGLLVGLSVSTATAADLDAYGGVTDVTGEQTGFFHTERIDGRWWLVTPDGHGFWGLGLSHPVTGMSQAAVTFTYGGSQEAWIRDGIRRMRELGYNCVWSGPYSQCRTQSGYVDKDLAERIYRESKMPYALQVPLIKHAVELAPGEKRPDVFSAEYTQFVVDEVARRVRPNRHNPWLLGYYYGFGCFMRKYDWVNETLQREPGSPGRNHLLTLLRQRYDDDIEEFNKVYRTSFPSFDKLLSRGKLTYPGWLAPFQFGGGQLPDRPGAARMLADAEAVFAELVERLYKVAHAEIRKHDPNHMILGGYVKDWTYSKEVWVRIAPYVDLLAPQDLSATNPVRDHVAATGLPVLMSDQEYGNVYPLELQGNPFTPGSVPDHVDRRVLYDLLADRIAGDPDMIGVSFCACLYDQSHWKSTYDRGQPGFFTIEGHPKEPELNRLARRANDEIMDTIRHPLNKASIESLDRTFHETREAYRVVMRRRMQLLRKTTEENRK